ncbi:hypothetical protein MAPG_03772 [Magnaporthiopsis poae ATCC 64411]|uniref:Polynucleotide 5'-hydroxyl-kinase GRC3 n=1 Tax=Magnaporthiopsis poae (strain ATCC 64411 / 73-15) TaxID=644358 RepID=A0A0C4DUX5_MAGP6|nr:hypothetical protein MAPG_03772 [Magnaporthiopsis poae ATCC 64411]
METRKRRKLGTAAARVLTGTRAQSAFELRAQLLRSQSSNPPVQEDAPDAGDVTDSGGDDEYGDPGSGSKSPADRQSGKPNPEPAEPTEAVAPASRTVRLSSFTLSEKNFRRKSGGLCLLKVPEGERAVILGSYGVRVQAGEVTVSSATLRTGGDIVWIHSPRCHALPVLRFSEGATLELHPHPASANLRRLGELSPKFERLWNEGASEAAESQGAISAKDAFTLLYTTDDGPRSAPLQELVSLPEWNKTLATLTKASKQERPFTALVCGPKSSGKSTFSRLLANRFITDGTKRRGKTWLGVAVLDIDPGQPEFGPPGVLSLVYTETPNLEPPFCHPFVAPNGRSKTLRSHSIAAISPITNSDHYLECVLDLYNTYNVQLGEKCPLVINTCGWVQGTGLSILTELVAKVCPTEVVYMSKEGPEDTIDGLRMACEDISLTLLPSQSSKFSARTAQDLRTMQMMSYFHMDLSGVHNGHLQWNPDPLTSAPPWIVKYHGPNRGIYGIVCYDYQPSLDMLGPLIDGMILTIVEIEDKAAFRGLLRDTNASHEGDAMVVDDDPPMVQSSPEDGPTPIEITPEGLPLIPNHRGVTLDPKFSRAVGLALVRGIDPQSHTLQLLTPVPQERISEIDSADTRLVLVWGKLDAAPTWSYVEDRHRQDFESRTKQVEQGVDGEGNGKASGIASDGRTSLSAAASVLPWVEALQGNQKRAAGSKPLRVRRDLGRGAKNTD